ncbi:hypothetical protein [uncultured Methanofollis sp.]|uniref:hypothetical protein n=1 Tax=uncultured Methanofollis sp. TaxID=262500 RepID=UPI0026065A0E|nr:hypothetical protein [uncultured Methanofollis sp.]
MATEVGVAPTVRMPLDGEALARAMAGEDVQIAYAVAWLEEQARPARTLPDAGGRR